MTNRKLEKSFVPLIYLVKIYWGEAGVRVQRKLEEHTNPPPQRTGLKPLAVAGTPGPLILPPS